MKSHRPTYKPIFRFSQPYTPETPKPDERIIVRTHPVYLEIGDETYLTEAEAVEYLEWIGATQIKRADNGLLYWRAGSGNSVFASEPMFLSGIGWRYLLSELE